MRGKQCQLFRPECCPHPGCCEVGFLTRSLMLRYAYFSEFGGTPTLLIWGGGAEMDKLAACFRSIAAGKQSVGLDELPQATSVDGITVRLELANKPIGLWRDP